jgi:trehalose synthase
MYGTLALMPKALDDYEPVVGDDAVQHLRALARPLKGLRVLHLSVTAFGTGVADLLHSAVPLLEDLGLDCRWEVVRPTEEFYAANRELYRALAGGESDWADEMGEVWLRYGEMNAAQLTEPFDVIVVHDPQPAALRSFVSDEVRQRTRWVLHSHLDLSSAAENVWSLLRPHIEPYDAVVFDTEPFVPAGLDPERVTIIPPAIDPLGPRNMELGEESMRTILNRYCVDIDRPLILQFSPCDPGSDMLGAIDVHDLVRREVKDAHLVLVAASPPEDPASIRYFDETVRKAMEYPDVCILRGISEVGNVEVNALQRCANVVLQKGLRRGFGIWIADAQWKRRPVVTAATGGLAEQVIDGRTGFLASDTEAFAARSLEILKDDALAERLGEAGHRHVAERFLITRFLADSLRLLGDLVGRGR